MPLQHGPHIEWTFFYDNCAKCAILDIYKIHAKRSGAENFSNRCLKLSILGQFLVIGQGQGGPLKCPVLLLGGIRYLF